MAIYEIAAVERRDWGRNEAVTIIIDTDKGEVEIGYSKYRLEKIEPKDDD